MVSFKLNLVFVTPKSVEGDKNPTEIFLPIFHYGRDLRSYMDSIRRSENPHLEPQKSSPISGPNSMNAFQKQTQTAAEIRHDLERRWKQLVIMRSMGVQDGFFEVSVSDGDWKWDEGKQKLYYYHAKNPRGHLIQSKLNVKETYCVMEAFNEYGHVVHGDGLISKHFDKEQLHEITVKVISLKEVNERVRQMRQKSSKSKLGNK